jgi:DNA-binding GntR family transcriptional regulator
MKSTIFWCANRGRQQFMGHADRFSAPVIQLRAPDAPVSALGIAKWTARAIERGMFKPGARLREQDLVDRFHCSRGPVREALRILESQGMVVIEPMKGARVASVHDATFIEVFLIRRALAALMAEETTRCTSPEAKANLVEAARRPLQVVESGIGVSEFVIETRKAVRAMMAAANLPRTVQIVRGLTYGREAFQERTLATIAMRRRHAKAWDRYASAVEAGDAEAARKAVERLFDIARIHHLENAMRAEQEQE